MSNYSIESADKAELGSQTWKVVRDNKIFLRIIKTRSSQKDKYPFELVTATAKDNSGKTVALSNQERVLAIKAAKKTSIDIVKKDEPSLKYDWAGREYISIFVCMEEGIQDILEHAADTFFAHYDSIADSLQESEKLEGNDLVSLYRDIHVEEGEAVYLSDGMWLTPDGRLIEK